jgi:alcohol dehydrogenase class IV
MRFEFATATRVIFGRGTAKELVPAAQALGRRALIVHGKSGRGTAGWIEQLTQEGVSISEFLVSGEPTVEVVEAGLEQARDHDSELVISLGGGSVIDTGKAIAALLANPGRIYDYLEVVGKGKPLTNPSVPYIAIPTTSGTGSEVTRNAVITVADQRVKVSLRSPSMLPRLAIVDPDLALGVPPDITAFTGLDALTQLIEPFLSNAANPMTDALCREGMRYAARSLRQAYDHGDDPQAREGMAFASLFGGLALANAKLGAVHGFAGPIGGMFPAPHGAICARLLPLVVEGNLKAIRSRAAQPSTLERFIEMSRLLTGNQNARAEEGIIWLHELCTALKVPPLAAYGVTSSDFPEIIRQAKRASSMKGNPVELLDSELTGMLDLAL